MLLTLCELQLLQHLQLALSDSEKAVGLDDQAAWL
jgi:hypothetical protein